MSRGPRDVNAGRLRRLGADLGSTGLASVGVALALDGSLLSCLLIGLALLAVAGRALSMLRQGRSSGFLTTQLAQRALLGAAVGSSVALLRPEQAVPAAVGTVLLVGALLYEPYLQQGTQVKVPVVANLPGIRTRRLPRDLSRPLLVGDLAAAFVGVLVAYAGLSGWWWVLAAALATTSRAAIARDSARRLAELKLLERELPGAVAAYGPEVAIYTSWPGTDGSHQVTMWLPYLQRTGRRCVVITRNSETADALGRLVDVPVLEVRGAADLDVLVPPSLKVVFYPNASSGNGVFVRYPQCTHVFLGHGDSDKPTSFNPTHAMYDRVFCAGPAAIRRYADHGVLISPEKFVVVGRPQVESIAATEVPISSIAQPVVLYAPTWRGHVEETSLSSLPVGEVLVQGLLDAGVTVMFRPHPFSLGFRSDAAVIEAIHRLLAADRARTGRQHRWGAEVQSGLSITDCFNASDALVSDVSSVVSDYLFSGKPYAMVAVPAEPEDFREAYPVARGAYVLRGDATQLAPALTAMLGDDPLAQARRELRVDYLGPFPPTNYATAFVGAVEDLVSAPKMNRDSDDTVDEAVHAGGGTKTVQEAGDPADSELTTAEDTAGPPAGSDIRPVRRSPSGSRGRLKKLRRRLVKPRRYNQAGACLALLALAAALVGARGSVVTLLGLMAVASIYWSVHPTVRRRKRWARLLGESRGARVVMLCAAAVAMPPDRLSTEAALAVLVMLSCAVVGEAHVHRSWGRLGLDARNLPAVSTQVDELVPRGVLALAGFAALILVLLAVTVPFAGWVVVVAASVVFLLFTFVAARALHRAARVVGAEYRLKEALTAYAPQYAVYFASTEGADYQIGMWAPYFARIGRPFIVITRSAGTMGEIARALRRHGVEVPVICRPTLRSLEDVMVPSLTTAFYVNNAARNTHFIERRELTHVWLNHGDSEKPACYNPVHAIYDLIFVAGQAGVERYARHGVSIPSEKFRIVGRPQVEVIEQRHHRMGDQPPTVLYAPTWQGPYADTRLFSLPIAVPLVEHLLAAGVRVIFRAHPLNYRFPSSTAMISKVGRLLARHRKETGVEHLWGSRAEKEMTIEDCFNASDAMIADVSAVVSDYLYSDKPFAIVAIGRSVEDLMRDAPAARAGYLLLEDLSNLPDVLADILGPDPLADVRSRTRRHYLGDVDREHYADGFLQAARTVIDARSLAERQRAAALSTGE